MTRIYNGLSLPLFHESSFHVLKCNQKQDEGHNIDKSNWWKPEALLK